VIYLVLGGYSFIGISGAALLLGKIWGSR